MTAVTVFNGLFCDADPVVKEVSNITGYRVVTDIDVIDEAARISGIGQETILDNFPAARSVSGPDRSDRDRVFSALRFAMAKMASEERNLIFWGYMALLPPPRVENLLRVCLISEMDARIKAAARTKGCSEAKARELIRANDQIRSDLVLAVTDCNDPWSERLYDLRIPVASTGIRQSAQLIAQHLADAEQDPLHFGKSMEDFLLESTIQAALARKGQDVSVSSRQGSLTLYFNNCRHALDAMSRQLTEIVSGLHGVDRVEIGVGRQYNHNDLYELMPRRMPSGNHLRHMSAAASAHAPSGREAADQALAAEVRNSLSGQDLDISVRARDGLVSLRINDHKGMLRNLSRTLCGFVSGFDGVRNVSTGIGAEYHQISAYMAKRRDLASAFVADDERRFVLALSDRVHERTNAEAFTFRTKTVGARAPREAVRVATPGNRAYCR